MARANYAHRSNGPLFMALTISSLEIEKGASQVVSVSGQWTKEICTKFHNLDENTFLPCQGESKKESKGRNRD